MSRILIGVLSAHAYTERRQACWETWAGQAKQHGLDLVFALGDPTLPAPERSGERLLLPCRDDYTSLSNKTRWLCRWMTEETSAEWLFKCDDDTYVHLPRFMAFMPEAPYAGHEMGGYCSGGAGYWLRRDAAAIVAARLEKTTWCEDWEVGKVLGEAGVPRQGSERFHPWDNRWPEPRNDLITSHYCTPARMREIHAGLAGERETQGLAARSSRG